MDALDRIRTKINDFQGYGSEPDLVRSDEEVRAYAGERLAALRERLAAEDPGSAPVLDSLIMRAAFANQRILSRLEWSSEAIDGSGILDADAALLELADEAASVTAQGLGEYASRVTAAFDARDAALASRS